MACRSPGRQSRGYMKHAGRETSGFHGDIDCTGMPPSPVLHPTRERPSSLGLEMAPIEALRPSCEGLLARDHWPLQSGYCWGEPRGATWHAGLGPQEESQHQAQSTECRTERGHKHSPTCFTSGAGIFLQSRGSSCSSNAGVHLTGCREQAAGLFSQKL